MTCAFDREPVSWATGISLIALLPIPRCCRKASRVPLTNRAGVCSWGNARSATAPDVPEDAADKTAGAALRPAPAPRPPTYWPAVRRRKRRREKPRPANCFFISSTARRQPGLIMLGVGRETAGRVGRRWRNGRSQRSALMPDAANLSASATSSGASLLPPAPCVSTMKSPSVTSAAMQITRGRALHPACHQQRPRRTIITVEQLCSRAPQLACL